MGSRQLGSQGLKVVWSTKQSKTRYWPDPRPLAPQLKDSTICCFTVLHFDATQKQTHKYTFNQTLKTKTLGKNAHVFFFFLFHTRLCCSVCSVSVHVWRVRHVFRGPIFPPGILTPLTHFILLLLLSWGTLAAWAQIEPLSFGWAPFLQPR